MIIIAQRSSVSFRQVSEDGVYFVALAVVSVAPVIFVGLFYVLTLSDALSETQSLDSVCTKAVSKLCHKYLA